MMFFLQLSCNRVNNISATDIASLVGPVYNCTASVACQAPYCENRPVHFFALSFLFLLASTDNASSLVSLVTLPLQIYRDL